MSNYITKEINSIKVTFESECEEKYLDGVIVEILNAFTNKIGSIKKVWIDIGREVYDIHMEIDGDDLYMSIVNDKLMGIYTISDIDFIDVLGKDLTSRFIGAIKLARIDKFNIKDS